MEYSNQLIEMSTNLTELPFHPNSSHFLSNVWKNKDKLSILGFSIEVTLLHW